jgi:hypothetical protein
MPEFPRLAEIKSAIELAMERTKGLVMDDQEKQEAAAKELGLRIGGLLRRYLEEMIDWDDFRKEYAKLEGKKAQKNQLLIDMALDVFDLSDNNDKVFDILSFVGGDVDDTLKKEIESLQHEFHETMRAGVEDVTKSITARLQKMGISGDGVEPNITEWDEWRSALEMTKSLFKKRLAEWKIRFAGTLAQPRG